MKIDGGCHCGQITYEAEIDAENVRICHCTDCQVLSGTAFRVNVHVPEEKFRIRGTPKIYVKTGESGNRRAQAFCADCGTHIYATNAEGDGPKAYGIRVGTSRQRAEIMPARAIWGRSMVKWLAKLATLPTAEKQN